MMILRTSPPSPYGRKIKIAASLLNLDKDIKVETADTNDPTDTLRNQNPLGKIPILVLPDGLTLFDSRVIMEYLDHLAGGGRIIPAEPGTRFKTLRLQALADGILDASLLLVYEKRFRPEERHERKWIDYQSEKVKRGLDVLEKDPPAIDATPNVGQIALACALGYQDLRFQGLWRKSYPKLVAWLDDFARRVPSFGTTKVEA
ncbi:MAG: glutathione S-transferase family protein [Pseudorhodoplanes sp.]|nr:glutathione S-transferase family protein [Pseudorhodoplanes sp.]